MHPHVEILEFLGDWFMHDDAGRLLYSPEPFHVVQFESTLNNEEVCMHWLAPKMDLRVHV